jgi:hypothetical protein
MRTRRVSLKGIDEVAESLLDLGSGNPRGGPHRPGLGTRLDGVVTQLISDVGERIEGRLDASSPAACS